MGLLNCKIKLKNGKNKVMNSVVWGFSIAAHQTDFLRIWCLPCPLLPGSSVANMELHVLSVARVT